MSEIKNFMSFNVSFIMKLYNIKYINNYLFNYNLYKLINNIFLINIALI